MPEWCDKDKIGQTMNRRKKRTSVQTDRDNFAAKATRDYKHAKYKDAFKEATILLAEAQKGPNAGKKGFGSRSAVSKEDDSAVSSLSWKNTTASDTAVTSQYATTNQKSIALLLTQQ